MSSSAMAISRLSMSSPPRWVSPLVAMTSKMPSCSLRIEMSKVPPPKIVNRDRAVFFLVEPVGQRGRRRLVDQAQNFEPGNAAGVFRGLPLRVIEVRGNGDDRLGHRRGEIALGIALELAQDERGNLRRREGLVAQLDAQHFARREVVGQAEREELQLVLNVFDAAAHQALDAIHCALGSLDQIFAGGIADDDLVVLIERDDRGHEVQPIFAGDDDGAVLLHVRDQRVGGAEVDSDNAVR